MIKILSKDAAENLTHRNIRFWNEKSEKKGKLKMYKTKNMGKWIGYDFDADELKRDRIFKIFARSFKAEIESQLAEKEYEIVIYKRKFLYKRFYFKQRQNEICLFLCSGCSLYEKLA